MKTKEELNILNEEVATLNKKLSELSKEELEEVSGGGFFDWVDEKVGEFSQWVMSDMDYKSGNTPKFTSGQNVRFFYADKWWNGVIVRVDSKNGGIFDTEYLYTVRHSGYTITVSGIYESNIRAS